MAQTTPRNNFIFVLNAFCLSQSTHLLANLRTSACHLVTSIVTNVRSACKSPNLTMCGEHVAHPSAGDTTVVTVIDTCWNIISEPNPAVLKQIVIDNMDICCKFVNTAGCPLYHGS